MQMPLTMVARTGMRPKQHSILKLLQLFLILYAIAAVLAVDDSTEVSIVEGTLGNVTIINLNSDYNSLRYYISSIISENRHTVFDAHFHNSDGKITTQHTISRDSIASELNNPHLPVEFNIEFTVFDKLDQYLLVAVLRKTLRILDLDNNEPRFVGYESSAYPIMISEGESGYEILPLVTDEDEGVNSTQDYNLYLSPTFGSLFVLDIRRNEVNNIVREIRLLQNGTLDREQQSNYMLQLIATEGNMNPQSATLMINVTILDVCDEPPMFPNSRFYATIKENSPSGSMVLSNITATDTDTLDVGKIRHRINLVCSSRYEDSACLPLAISPFQLDRESGDLTIFVDNIDRETFAEYELTIIAEDSCMQGVTATVVVTVENVNDNAPILTPLGSGDVHETQLVNSTIFFLTVRDDDYGRDRDSPLFSVTLHENSTGVLLDTNVFVLYSNNDRLELRLGQGLDREVTSGYSLVINTTDWGTPNISTIDHLLINVLDVNDNLPIFQPVEPSYSADEESMVGTTIAMVTAVDIDSVEGGNGRVSYSIPPNNSSFPYQDYLTVDPNGHLIVAQRIDREEQETFFVLVKAQDNPTSNPFTDYVVVNIRLIDINDNTPTIVTPQESLRVVETQPSGSVVFTVSAYDNDTVPFSTIMYHFTTTDIPFEIDVTSGKVTLTTALDYEIQTSYSFEVVASDGENEDRKNVTIEVENINDERCIFDESVAYTTSVHEEMPGNLRVFDVDATDRDTPTDQLRFSIVAGNEKEHFSINQSSGEVFTTRSLDNEMVSNYSLMIQCSDGSDTPTTTYVYLEVIDVNDNVPQFVNIPYSFSVSENLGVENPVGTVLAVDADSSTNGAIRYKVVHATPSSVFSWFTLDPDSGMIVTNRELDREDTALEGRNGLIMLDVQAVDLPSGVIGRSNNTIVSILVVDQNDHYPMFEQSNLTITVRENFVVGNSLPGRVMATDRDSPPNNAINYIISGSTPEAMSFFGVNMNTGVIVLLSPLNFESMRRHEFIVLAIDPNMVEHQTSQTVVVEVMVPEVNITLVNFHHSVQVQENSPLNYRVTEFGVTDNNGNPIMRTVDVIYTIKNENGIGLSDDFGLMNDTENSVLIVYVKRKIDRETLPVGSNGLVQRVLNVTVRTTTHGSVTVNLTVTIQDQNDNHPVFLLPSYTFQVQENNDVSVPIGSVSAMDSDFGINGSAGVSFQVTDSTAFQITVDGQLRSMQSLDREALPSHSFYIIASDGASPPMTNRVAVQVIVGDLNDNKPFFNPMQNRTFYVGEETRVDTVVATLSVSDADSDLFGPVNVFIGDVLSQHFRIERNGSIVLIQSLDRETADSLFFTVMATDSGGMSTTADVTIIVEDYNDNIPVFNPIPTTTIVLDEDQPEDMVFLTVSATDADIGYSGIIRYAIGNYSLSQTFCINQQTGQIRLCSQHISCQDEDVTNFERRSMYSVSIIAYDLGTPQQIASKTISIIIHPVNEHPPMFDRGVLFVYVDETQDSNVEVVRISAVDQDKDDRVTYQVLDDNQQSELFRYDADRGAIINNGNLDFDTQAVHTLTLRATDSGNKMDNIQIIIAVNKINTHPPIFFPNVQPNSMSQPLVIKESTPVPTVVWTVRASDGDNATLYDAVSYHIDGADDDLRFMIDSLTGEISINNSLDYEQRDSYTLRIHATDTGSPQMTSSLTIWISIENENDELPFFNLSTYFFSVAENEDPMMVVGHVYALDRDSGDYGMVHYSISQGINDLFDVDPTNGDIFTLRVIDRDVLASNTVLFTVHAIDGATGLNVNTAVANVEVTIIDVNDNAPELTAAQYFVSISPNQTAFILISTLISASDRDEGTNAQHYYAIEDSSSSVAINVSSTTGQLMLKEPIPSEHQLAYIYTLRAVDSRDASLFSSARLELLVETDNDHHPRFNPVVSTVTVSELSRSGTELFLVSSVVTDADSGENGHLTYTFAQSYLQFRIDSESGRISLREILDFEDIKMYNLTVQAVDNRAGVRRTATGVVRVKVLPGNEFEPKFVNLPSEFTFSYLPEVGLELFTVTATDQDEGTDGSISYNIVDPNHYFTIDLHQGVVRNLVALESDVQFNVTIEARDFGTPFHTCNTNIRIIIRNAEPSTPNFIGLNPRPITKPEDITLGSFINTALITNPSAQSYHLVKQTVYGDSTPIETFSITEGQGRLSIIQLLDYEETNMYNIIVEARVTSTGSSSEQRASDFLHVTLVVTNVNDNEPVFTGIADQVFSENTPVRTTLLFQVEAIDNDLGQEGMLFYDIIHGDSERTFAINSSTGDVYLRRQLDREVVSSYNLLIQAQDLSNQPHSSHIMVHVTVTDVNDFVTTYGGKNYSLHVYESPSTSSGDRIIKLSATDLDTGPPLRYTMNLVEASHSGNPLNILNFQSSFVIDPFSGFINVGSLTLDRESVDCYLFLVTATDRINVADTYLMIKILDVNDHAPEVTVPNMRVRVMEGIPAGILVFDAITVTDADVGVNSWVKYSLGSGWPQNYFRIDPLSGVIRTNDVIIARSSILNFAGDVIVEDQGVNTHRVTEPVYITIVDVNNHAPMFESDAITLKVSITTMPSTKVHKFNVTDEDFTVNASPLMFLIPHYFSDAGDNFIIDSGDGTLTLNQPQSQVRSFSFQVDVSNPSFTPQCVQYMQASSINVTILITPINTVCPVFSQPQYNTSVAEGEPDQNRVLIGITASDFDGDSISYSVVNSTAPFSVHPMTGDLIGTGSLDRESRDNYQLTILATDSGYPPLSCSATVSIIVTDVNDNRPVFTASAYAASLRENSPANTSVVRVTANDTDLGNNGKVSYHLSPTNLPFRIDTNTGDIFSSGLLDYEKKLDYNFNVVASDSGNPASSSSVPIAISLTDVNEGAPKFTDVPSSPITVNANMARGSLVYTVTAIDPDTRIPLLYSFLNPEPNCYFDLNNRTGVVTLKVDPNSENTCSSTTTAVRSKSNPFYFIVEAVICVTDGKFSLNTTVEFSLHESFGMPIIPTPQSFPIEIISASVTGVLVVMLVFVIILIIACICRSKRSKVLINDNSPQALELRKKFGSSRSSGGINKNVSMSVYKQASLGPLPPEHTTMSVAAHPGGSSTSSTRQSYVCNGEPDSGGGSRGGGLGMNDRVIYPSPVTVSKRSELSKPYRSTSDLGSSTMATDMLSNGSQETAPYPKSQIERIYAKNADLLDSGSNESIHMFGSEGGGESDGGDDLYGKFNDLDDDDDSTTMQDDDDEVDDNNDRDYRRRSIPSPSIPPVEGPYTPYNHSPVMTNWVPRTNNMAETIDQIPYGNEKNMRRNQHYVVDEFSKSQGGMSGYQGGGSNQESTQSLLRHTHHHPHHLHHPQELPLPHQQTEAEFYYDDTEQVQLHDHRNMRGLPHDYSSSSRLPSYPPHDIPRHLPMGRHPGGGVGNVIGGEVGGSSQEVPPIMGGYGYHGDYMHHPMHLEMGTGTHSPSSTPTEEALNTRALTNEYESDIMYSSDTSLNTNTESDQPRQQQLLQHPHQQMRGPPRGFSQPGPNQRVFSQPGSSHRHAYH